MCATSDENCELTQQPVIKTTDLDEPMLGVLELTEVHNVVVVFRAKRHRLHHGRVCGEVQQ